MLSKRSDMSKTPQFDKALRDYYASLKLDEKSGQERKCRFSGNSFYVTSEDISFYKRVGVPLPTLEPHERRRGRSGFMNCYKLFKNKSAATDKTIITMYPPGSPYKIYEHSYWYSDKWDPGEYERNYDPRKSFFDQYGELQRDVPRPSLLSDVSNVNSDYTNSSKNLKNCYLTFDQNKGENLYYHQCCEDDKNCIECWALDFCETCYGCKVGHHLFRCFYCEQCSNCLDSYFLYDCRGCNHCFMSSNLRNKKYYFRNEFAGKEEYEKRMREVYLGSNRKKLVLEEEYEELKKKAIRKPDWNEKSSNSSGNFIKNSKNIKDGFWVVNSENIVHSEGIYNSKDSYDALGVSDSELCYAMASLWGGKNYLVKFSAHVDNCREVEYSEYLKNCTNCLGCIGLKNKKFHIFNKAYSEDDYYKKIEEIKIKMLAVKEYGEFFPLNLFPFSYKVSDVTSYRGYRDYENAEKYGYDMSDMPETASSVEGEVLRADELPDDIKDIGNDILEKTILDEKNNKKFRYIKPELEFYRTHGIAPPREHPSIRMDRWRDSFEVVTRTFRHSCLSCGVEVETMYAPDDDVRVYCEKCYQKEVV